MLHRKLLLPFSHDEVVTAKIRSHKMPGTLQQFANLRLLYAYQYGIRQEAAFHGQEFGQRASLARLAARLAPAAIRFASWYPALIAT